MPSEHSFAGHERFVIASEKLLPESGSKLFGEVTCERLISECALQACVVRTRARMRMMAVVLAFIVERVQTIWFGSLGCLSHAKPSVCWNWTSNAIPDGSESLTVTFGAAA